MNLSNLNKDTFKKFFNEFHQQNSRGYAWIDVNTAFLKRTKNTTDEELAKALYIFLANWGMVSRGAFLMQHNYRILIPVVKILTGEKYSVLQNPEIDAVESNVSLIINLKKEINEELKKYTDNRNTVSGTLISKIMMGALGCTVAYDTYVKKELKAQKIALGVFSENSIKEICGYYKAHNIESLRKEFVLSNGTLFPPLKFFDLLLWTPDNA